MHKEVRRLIW